MGAVCVASAANKMEKYQRELSEIKDTIIEAYNHWEIWWFYKSERPKYVKVMKYLIKKGLLACILFILYFVLT